MNRGLSILFVALSLIVLAGCRVSTPPLESLGEVAVEAAMSPDIATDEIVLGPYEYVTYRISTSGTIGQDVLWFEVATEDGASGPVLLLESSDQTFRSLSEHGFVLEDSDLLLPTQPGIHTAAIGVNQACLGPCIAVESIRTIETLQVINRSSITRRLTLYVFEDSFEDLNEPENDLIPDVPALLPGEDVDSGAIEVIGDWDYYDVSEYGFFELTVPSGAPIMAEVVGPDGTTVFDTVSAGERAEVFADEFVRVRSVNDAYAGPPNPDAALYYVSLF